MEEDGEGSDRAQPTVGIVGAGIAGLACARRLADAGLPVRVLDRSRGPAGRAATRRVELEVGGRVRTVRFDHGAQYATVRDPGFRRALREAARRGDAAPWEGRIGAWPAETGGAPGDGAEQGDGRRDRPARWVGVPGMSALGRGLARGLDVEWGVAVDRIAPAGSTPGPDAGPPWVLVGADGREHGPFGAVVVAAPAPQAAPVLEGVSPELAAAARAHETRPCWTAMAAFDRRLPVGLDGAFVNEGPLSWAARNSSKPGRAVRPEAWVLHAGPDWSEERGRDADPDAVARRLLAAFFRAAGIPPREPIHLAGHRWWHARSAEPREDSALADAGRGLFLAGDWLAGDRVEGAWLSGRAAARRLL